MWSRPASMQLRSPLFLVVLAGVVICQLPPSQFGRPVEPSRISDSFVGGQADLQDAMEGIEGLMQRFESLQPQLGTLARSDLESIASEGQQLHVRFLDLQGRVGTIGASQNAVPATEEGRVIGFHRDLALFMARVESKLGITGPVPTSRLAFNGQGNSMVANDNAQANARTPSPPFQNRMETMDERLQSTMQKVADGMQRFEVLHPKLRSLSPQAFNEIATRGQRLHEEFQSLQRRGAELSGGGGRAGDAEAAQYVANFEAFSVEQAAFIKYAETQVQNSMSGGIPLSAAGLSGVGSPTMHTGGLPSVSASASGRVTPATDARLSAVISKIVTRMQEFEGLKPQFNRLPQQIFSNIAQRGQVLNDRFMVLQQRGAQIAGDGSAPMLESDASMYAAEMEAFHTDQVAYVEEAKVAVQSGGSGLAGGMVGAPLGSASLNSATSSGFGTPPGIGLAPLGVAGFGGPSFGQSSGVTGVRPLGAAASFGGSAGLPRAQLGANSPTAQHFGSQGVFQQPGMLHSVR